MKFTRFYSDGTPVETQVRWARFDSKITAADGSIVFEMKDVEAPENWSQGAVDILAQKYFRKAGVPNSTTLSPDAPTIPTPVWLIPSIARESKTKSETSAKQVFHRLAGCWTYWGWKSKLFSSEEDARIFYDETYLMLARQIAAPNSPQFFNCGLHWAYGIIGPDCGQWAFDESGNIFETHDSYSRPQVHACYIQPLSDDLVNLGGIMDLALREAKVFKHGSGSGSNVSNIRATGEKLSGGGTSSGLISFLRVLDRAAGAIKSGGVTRRAAKMVILDLDHPDIEEFIHWKYNEEQKARALVAAGYSEADALETISGQNANNSVRVPNKFLSAIADKDIQWGLYERTTGKAAKYVKAYDLWTEICRAAWLSGDPGVQFSDTINSWHTCKADGDIIASNPCCFVGETRVDTSEGKIPFSKLHSMFKNGEELPLAFGFDLSDRMPILSKIKKVWIAGEATQLVRVVTDKGLEFICTPEHRFLTRYGKIEAGTWVEAKKLQPGDRFRKVGRLVNSLRQDRCTISTRKGDFYQNRFIWEQVHGPIPDGYDVHHKDDNPQNDKLSNYELIESTEHKSVHFSGSRNPKYINATTTQLIEVFEAVEKIKKRRENGHTGAHYINWNSYVRKNNLVGIVPLANSGTGRIRGQEWSEFCAWIEENRGVVNHRVVSVEVFTPNVPVTVYDLEVEGSHHNFGVTSYSDDGGDSVIAHNSEYLFLDSTACNLASLNLVKFLDSQGTFDTRAFEHAVRIWTAVLDISVTMASYPSREIAEGTWKYRTLGLGYANLGGLLMRKGIPYDSTEGRQIAAQIVAQLQYTAYSTSAEMAVELGAFPRYEANKNHVSNVLAKHDAASRGIVDIHYAVDAKVRNAQVSVTAPTGTIALLMDCDTTGIEPDFSLVKLKKLAGGGEMRIVNQSVPIGLKSLGYTATQIAAILAHIEKTGTVLGMAPRNGDPFIAPEHISVFATAVGENSISPEAHVRMVAAVQPFISGGISKTVNMPNSATVEDVDKIYRLAHELGCKSIAIYRDGCKLSQPLSEGIQKPDTDSGFLTKTGIHILSEPDDNDLPSTEKTEFKPTRRRLPKRRFGYTNEYTVDGQKLFLRTGEYDDGTLGEVFVNLSKEGSTARALMEAWAKAVSLGLQFGVPLGKFVNSFTHIRFEPAGIVSGHDQIKMCSSLIDLVMRDLGISYLNRTDLGHVPALEEMRYSIPESTLEIPLRDVCWECGQPTLIRTGTCLECTNCHANTGCG